MLRRKHNTISIIFMALACLSMIVVLATCADDDGGDDNGGNAKYTCENGTAKTGKPSGKSDEEYCMECNLGYTKGTDNACNLSAVGSWKFDSNNTCSTNPACTVDIADDGTVKTVMWGSDCGAHAPLNGYITYEIDSGSIIFKGGGSQHDFIIESSDTYLILNPHSTTLSGSRYLCPNS